MATKDWKKTREMTWKLVKDKVGHIQNTIYIDRSLIPIHFGRKEELLYGVHIGYTVSNGRKVVNRSEYFKTKAQALKFARSYMRSH